MALKYEELRHAASVDDVFLQNQRLATLTSGQFPISVTVGEYSPNLFVYMGVPPFLGRVFTPSDAPGGKGAPVALLSYLFWQKQFAGNRDVVGKTIELDHKLYTVIGVVGPRFTWGDTDVYVPGMPSGDPHDYWMSFLKLKPGVKHPAAAAELQVLLDRFTRDDTRDFRRERRVAIVTLNEEILGRFSGTLVLLFGAVIALLVHRMRQRFDSLVGSRNCATARVGSSSIDRSQSSSANPAIAYRICSAVDCGCCAWSPGRLPRCGNDLRHAPAVLLPS